MGGPLKRVVEKFKEWGGGDTIEDTMGTGKFCQKAYKTGF